MFPGRGSKPVCFSYLPYYCASVFLIMYRMKQISHIRFGSEFSEIDGIISKHWTIENLNKRTDSSRFKQVKKAFFEIRGNPHSSYIFSPSGKMVRTNNKKMLVPYLTHIEYAIPCTESSGTNNQPHFCWYISRPWAYLLQSAHCTIERIRIKIKTFFVSPMLPHGCFVLALH